MKLSTVRAVRLDTMIYKCSYITLYISCRMCGICIFEVGIFSRIRRNVLLCAEGLSLINMLCLCPGFRIVWIGI